MNLKNTETFLCVVVVLTICQYVRTELTNAERNNDDINNDDDSIVVDVDKSNYDSKYDIRETFHI